MTSGMAERYDQNTGRWHRNHGTSGISFIERPGSGPVVVFLHGIGSNAESFAAVFERFPEGPRLIAWNAPGYLASEPLETREPEAKDYAMALVRFLDSLGVQSVHIVGHSLGTLIAAEFAVQAPERITSITLAAAAQGYGISAGEPLPLNAQTRLEDLARLGVTAFAASRAPRLVFQPEQNPGVVERVQTEMARINPVGYAQAVHMLATGDLPGSISLTAAKPGFIIGAEDRVTPMEQTQAALQAWAKAHGQSPRCGLIPQAGHAVYVQDPQGFIDTLLQLVPGLQTETPGHSKGEIYVG